MNIAVSAQVLAESAVRQRVSGRILLALLRELLPRWSRDRLTIFSNYSGLDSCLPDNARRVACHWPVAHRAARALWESLALPSLVANANTDVLLALSPFPVSAPCPRVVLCLDLNPLVTAQGTLRSSPVARVRHWLTKKGLRSADCIVTASTRSAQRLTRTLHISVDRVQVVPMGGPTHGIAAATERRVPDHLTPQSYLLWWGSQGAGTELPLVLSAFGQVAAHIPHQLVLIGPGGRDHRETRAAIAAAGLQSRVLCLGALAEEWHPAILRRSTAFIVPTAEDEFGRPVLEAFACGTTVIAGRLGPLPDLCGDAALFFDPPDANQLAGHLLDVVRDPELRARLVCRGELRAARFSWEAAATSVQQILLHTALRDHIPAVAPTR